MTRPLDHYVYSAPALWAITRGQKRTEVEMANVQGDEDWRRGESRMGDGGGDGGSERGTEMAHRERREVEREDERWGQHRRATMEATVKGGRV